MMTKLHSTRFHIFLALLFFALPISSLLAEETDASSSSASAMELVRVDWWEESVQGGVTMVALGILSIALVVIIVERLIMLRKDKFVPKGLVNTLCNLIVAGEWDGVKRACQRHPSVLSHAILFLPAHLGTDRETLMNGAADIAARELTEAEQRLGSLGLIAGLAPLLGLLGTMIGMVESFKLVEVFGDEGGASMLAGSISKALITTAAGLVLAMPALIAHYVFKRKTQRIAREVEQALEQISNTILRTQIAQQPVVTPDLNPEPTDV